MGSTANCWSNRFEAISTSEPSGMTRMTDALTVSDWPSSGTPNDTMTNAA